MSNPEYIRQLMLSCPYITMGPLGMHIDQTGAEPTSYGIESAPNEPTLRRYLSGDKLKGFAFALTARKPFFSDTDRAANSETYEQVALWMDRQTRAAALPDMGPGKRAMRLEATGSVYVTEPAEDGESALYAMQAQLIYYQEV